MKKLILPLAMLFITMSSFTKNTKEIVVIPQDCYSSCDTYANAIGYSYGLNAEQEFQAFSQCYDNYCSGGSGGAVTFPSGNVY